MLKSKIARKLSLYFAVALLIFALIIGCAFVLLFRSHTVNLHKTQLEDRANAIAGTLSQYAVGNGHMNGGYGAYVRFIGDIAGADVWIVDAQNRVMTMCRGHSTMSRSYSSGDLPENAEQIINQVLSDKTVFSEDFSKLLSELTLTVGVPIKDSGGNMLGVVLLHSPVHGINAAWGQGIMILLLSMTLALVVSFLLSIWLSKRFTDPISAKEAADALRLEKIRRDFVANVSHELKTPVTVLRGSLEALTDKVVTDPEKVAHYHMQMLGEAKFLERLVGDLLDLSRLQNMDFVIEKSAISMCDVLEDVMRSAEQLANKKGVALQVSKHEPRCQLYGDYGRLRQMLLIVLDNAIKFSPEKGVVSVTFSGSRLSVKDEGPGIAPEHLPFIFDRFYKSRTEDNKVGTGLGLAIAKQIAERHGIRLTAQSLGGQGATFHFELP